MANAGPMPDAVPVLEVRGVVTRFGTQTVHDGVDLTVRRGEVLGVVGGSGTGKSVLLRVMLGLMAPAAAGQVDVLGHGGAFCFRTVRCSVP